MEELKALWGRLVTFRRAYRYNTELIDPYLLASYGFVVEQSSEGTFGVCCECGLKIRFDGEETEEEDLYVLIREHDEECSFRKVKHSVINRELFESLGVEIYHNGLESIRKQQKHIQLTPS